MSSLINLYGESTCAATLGFGAGEGAVWRGQVTQRQFGFKEFLIVPIAGEGRYVQGKDLFFLWHTQKKIPLEHENRR